MAITLAEKTSEQAAKKKRRLDGQDFEPRTKESGKPFDPTTAPRKAEKHAKDVSQDLQDKTTTAPRKGVERKDSTSGTA